MTSETKNTNTDNGFDRKGMEGLLSKKISELIAEGHIDKLEKLLGTPERPFPMFGTMDVVSAEGKKRKQQVLSVIAEDENPLVVMSEKSFAEVWGIIGRELPTPSMLPIFREMLERLEPDSKNRQFFVMGDPGMGKSFMGGMIGRVMTDKSPKVYDCGGKQMNSMLFEMVLDFGSGEGPGAALDKKMQAGSLCDASKLILDNLSKDLQQHVNKLSDGVYEIDWNGLRGTEVGNENVKEAVKALNEVIKLEGLDNGGQNMLGMSSEFGPMITDFIEGRFATYDEYNKSKQGGDDALQTVLQFINGETDVCTVENPLKGKDGTSGPSEFTFRREDVKAGWGILFTGNKTKDGTTTRALNKSVYSRLGPRDLPEVDARDWQHRICQLMTGVPISTWYEVYKDAADENPEAFADFLWDMRTSGLSETQKKAIPSQHKVWIQNWQRVVEASRDLGKFFHGWRDRMDPDRASDVYHLMDDVDEDFSAEQSLDFRRVIKVLQKAAKSRARLKPKSFKPKLPVGAELQKEPTRNKEARENIDLGTNYGTRLVDLIITDIYESAGAIGKDLLHKSLMTLAEECNLIEKHLDDAARSNVRTIEDNLNISKFDSADVSIQARLAQKTFCAMVRERFPDVVANDNEIVTIDRLVHIIKDLREQQNKARETNKLTVPNMDQASLAERPFSEAELYDMADLNRGEEPFIDQILTQDEFLQAFVLPGLKEKNLEALWEDNLSFSAAFGDAESHYEDTAANIESSEAALIEQQSSLKSLNAKLASMTEASDDDRKTVEDQIKKAEEEISFIENRIDNMKTEMSELEQKINRIKGGDLSTIGRADADDQTANVNAEVDSFAMAENRSKSGFAFTTVACRVKDDPNAEVSEDAPIKMKPVHILRNKGKTLIIGGKIAPSLKAAFEKAKIKYVDYDQADAKSKLSTALTDFTRALPEKEMECLTDVFQLRNVEDVDSYDATQDLTDQILSHREIVQRSGEGEILHKFYFKPDVA